MTQEPVRRLPWQRHAAWVVLVLLLGFALRAYHLDFQSLWSDEGISLLRSGPPVGPMLRDMPVEHVPAYFLLLHAWLPIAGASDFALRYLSLLPSVLTLAIVYRLALDMRAPRVGLAACLLLATSNFQIWYAQEARMYSWLLAAGVASTWFLWRLVKRRAPAPETKVGRRFGPRAVWPALAGYVISLTLAIYLHIYGFMLPLAHGVFVLIWCLRSRDAAALRRWLLASAIVAVLYLPWLPHFLGIFGFSGWRQSLVPTLLPWQFLTAYTAGDTMPAALRTWLPWLYLALALLGLDFWRRRNPAAAWLLVCSTVVPVAATFLLALRKPDYHVRYDIFVSAPLLLLAAGGLAAPLLWLRQVADAAALRISPMRLPNLEPKQAIRDSTDGQAVRVGHPVHLRHPVHPVLVRLRDLPWSRYHRHVRLMAAGLAAVILAGLLGANGLSLQRLYTDPAVQKADYRTLAGAITEMGRPGDVILTDGMDPLQVFAHYYRGSLPITDLSPVEDGPDTRVARTLAAATKGAQRVWLLRHYHEMGPVESWLSNNAWLADRTPYGAGGLTASLYLLPGSSQADLGARATFGNGLDLTGAAVTGAGSSGDALALSAGDLVGVTTHWRAAAPLPALRLSLRLIDEDGQEWVSEDYVPGDGFAPTEAWAAGAMLADRHGLRLPPDLAAGRYHVELAVTDIQTDTAWPVDAGGSDALNLVALDVRPAAVPPDPAALAIPVRLNQSLGNLDLLGYDLAPQPLAAGKESTLTVWWRGTVRPESADELQVTLADGEGQAVLEQTFPLAGGQPAQIWRSRYLLQADPNLDSGTYQLRFALPDRDPAAAPAALGAVRFQGRTHSYSVPPGSSPVNARLDDHINLVAYRLDLPGAGGAAGRLTLYWQTTQPITHSYKVFVHVLDGQGQVVAQADSVPANWAAPTDTWLPGEVIADAHPLDLPATGQYTLQVGMYDPDTGQRLAGQDGRQQPLNDGTISLTDFSLPAPNRSLLARLLSLR